MTLQAHSSHRVDISKLIGLALLIPFSVDYRPLLAVALLNYGAVILSFFGALRWGFAMTVQDMSAEQGRDSLIWSVIPALIAAC